MDESYVTRTGGIIVTRSDRGIFDVCCIRCGMDPRDRRIRYVLIDRDGVRVVAAKNGGALAVWAEPLGK